MHARRQAVLTAAIAGFVAIAMIAAAAPSHAAEITPVSQDRSVTSDAIISPVAQQDFHTFGASSFGLFDMLAQSAISNSNAVSDASGTQQSTVDACAIVGAGGSSAHSAASAQGFHGYSIGVSTCRVVFDIDETAECLIAGTLQAQAATHAHVHLQTIGNQLLFSRTVDGGSLGVHQRAVLPPGRYIVTFDSQSDTASSGSGSLTTTGNFDLRFTLCFNPADVNVDGGVDIDDLFDVINGWGPCPGTPLPCAADIDLNGAIDVDDLFAVINAWGS